MTDYAEYLVGEQSNPTAALLQLLISDYQNYDAIAAVEGNDDRIFYYDYLRDYTHSNNIKVIDCGGKPSLLKFRDLVDEQDWDVAPRMLYLCDKDFDDYLGRMQNDIYYLPRYSIESYFSDVIFLDYIVCKFGSASLHADERAKIRIAFESMFVNFASCMRTIAALMIEVRAGNLDANFDAFSIADFFDLSLSVPSPRRHRFAIIRKKWDIGEIAWRSILGRAKTLDVREASRWLRGKYSLQLAKAAFQKAMQTLPKRIRDKCPSANHFSPESFRSIKLFLNDIPSLREYCEAH